MVVWIRGIVTNRPCACMDSRLVSRVCCAFFVGSCSLVMCLVVGSCALTDLSSKANRN